MLRTKCRAAAAGRGYLICLKCREQGLEPAHGAWLAACNSSVGSTKSDGQPPVVKHQSERCAAQHCCCDHAGTGLHCKPVSVNFTETRHSISKCMQLASITSSVRHAPRTQSNHHIHTVTFRSTVKSIRSHQPKACVRHPCWIKPNSLSLPLVLASSDIHSIAEIVLDCS